LFFFLKKKRKEERNGKQLSAFIQNNKLVKKRLIATGPGLVTKWRHLGGRFIASRQNTIGVLFVEDKAAKRASWFRSLEAYFSLEKSGNECLLMGLLLFFAKD